MRPEIQLKEPLPLVDNTWPEVPSAPGRVQMTEPASVSGALRDRALVVPLSFRTSLFALVALPWIVTLPATVVAPALMVPVVVIVEAPLMVALVRVLLFKVSVVERPTKVSVVDGKVRVPVLTMVPISGAVSVLLVSVSVAASVRTC